MRSTPQVIRSDEAYSVAEFRRRAGIGDYTWRDLRRRLRVVKIGRKQYVLGQTWLEFLREQADEDAMRGDR